MNLHEGNESHELMKAALTNGKPMFGFVKGAPMGNDNAAKDHDTVNPNDAQSLADRAAAKSKDGELKHGGETYKLIFDPKRYVYVVTDATADHVVTLNVKGLARAKSELKTWLET